MPRDEPKPQTPAQRFGRKVATAARAAGYDIDSPRSGGRAALARATGMEASSVGRMLKGETLPHPRYYEAIARAVGLPPRDLLIEAEIISADALTPPPQSGVASPVTPESAADELGIVDPLDRELFFGMVARLKSRRPTGADNGHTEDNGETAADG